MSLMSFFSSKPATPAPAATPDPASAPAAAAPVPAPEPQGLDKYSNLWKAPEPQKPQPSVLDLDQGKVVEGVSKLNFTQVISPELMQKATSGGPESQQAMMEAMNRVAQATAAQQQGVGASSHLKVWVGLVKRIQLLLVCVAEWADKFESCHGAVEGQKGCILYHLTYVKLLSLILG